MHLQFCGAAGEVTGSCTKLDIEEVSILVDCGLFQGNKFAEDKNYDPFLFKPEAIDAVILTHAHLDHCGRLPKLVNQGFIGKIYATDATRDLTALILLDAAKIQGEEAERHGHPPLYTEEDVVQTMERFMTIPYDKELQIASGVTVALHNAGHVLGSSFIEIKGDGKSAIFSGDIGNYPVPLLEQADDLPHADAMILESTYGDKTHGPYEEGVKILEEAIRDTIRDQGVLLVPAFSLERTQELLTVIDQALAAHRIPTISAYLDGPLGIKVSRVYEKYDTYFNDEIKALEAKEPDHSVLTFPSLTITETSEQSKMIKDVSPPKLIIAGSGMMQGGRILHHLKHYLPFPSTRLFVAGHQVEGSLGRQLLNGARVVTIHGEKVEVNAKILGTHSFSSHMDQHQLITWLKTMKKPPKVVFLNHGDEEARPVLSKLIQAAIGCKVYTPNFSDGYTLGREETNHEISMNQAQPTAAVVQPAQES
jgi:metallo-beta-lactamase family protein